MFWNVEILKPQLYKLSNFLMYLIRYDELTLKGNNRTMFEKRLIANIEKKVRVLDMTHNRYCEPRHMDSEV